MRGVERVGAEGEDSDSEGEGSSVQNLPDFDRRVPRCRDLLEVRLARRMEEVVTTSSSELIQATWREADEERSKKDQRRHPGNRMFMSLECPEALVAAMRAVTWEDFRGRCLRVSQLPQLDRQV